MLGDEDRSVQVTRLEGGYTLQALDGRMRLTHDCGKTVEIGDADEDPLRWHIGTHRCGLPSERWHVGVAPSNEAARLRRYGPGEVAGLMQYMALLVDAADPATFRDDGAFVAGQRVASSLETALAAAGRWRREGPSPTALHGTFIERPTTAGDLTHEDT